MGYQKLPVYQKGQVVYWLGAGQQIFEGSISGFIVWHGVVCLVVHEDSLHDVAIPLTEASTTREGLADRCFMRIAP